MELAPGLEIIHQPVRLKLVALLYHHGDVSVSSAVTALATSPGNLDAHARRLEAAGILEMRRALTSKGFESRLELTTQGIERFEAYLSEMRAFLAGMGGPL